MTLSSMNKLTPGRRRTADGTGDVSATGDAGRRPLAPSSADPMNGAGDMKAGRDRRPRLPHRIFGRPAPEDIAILVDHASGAHRERYAPECRACRREGYIVGNIEHEDEREPLYASRPPLGSGIEPGPRAHLVNVTEHYAPASELRGAVEALRLIAEHARLDHKERGIAEAERYALIAEHTLEQLRGQ